MVCKKCGCSIEKTRSDGSYTCGGCHKAKMREHYIATRPARLAYAREYYSKNAPAIRAYLVTYRRARAHSEEQRTQHRAHYVSNKADYFAAARNRAAMKRAALPGVRLTSKQWDSLLDQFGHRCAYCLEKRRLTMDHVTPLSKGGEHILENIVPACNPCNLKKGARPIFIMLNAA